MNTRELRLPALVLAAITVACAGCSGSPAPAMSSPAAAAPAAAPSAPVTSASGGLTHLPATRTTPTGNFVTLEEFTGASPVASARVKICTSAHTPPGTEAYPPFFTLQISDGSVAPVEANAAVSPALHATPLGPLQCVDGWISFAVPGGAHGTTLLYTALGPAITWTVG
jgi:hypothetical protein